MIALHRPKTVDSASSLAMLQVEELANAKNRPTKSMTKFHNLERKMGDTDKQKPTALSSETEDKLQALKQYRRRNGLSFKCGNKWGHNHKCLEQIPLHVLEEILDSIELQSVDDSKSE